MKITDKISIDGRLDEFAWEGAPRATSFMQSEPDEGRPVSEETEVRVMYDTDNLYFAVIAKDSEPQHVIVSEMKKDFTVENGDSFQLILDTFLDRRNGYQFAINPAGAKWDAQMVNEGRALLFSGKPTVKIPAGASETRQSHSANHNESQNLPG